MFNLFIHHFTVRPYFFPSLLSPHFNPSYLLFSSPFPSWPSFLSLLLPCFHIITPAYFVSLRTFTRLFFFFMYFRYSSHCLPFSSKSLFLLLIFILVFQFPLICPTSFTSVDSAFPAHSCPAAQLYPGVLRQQLPRIIPTLISQDYCEAFLGFIWQPRLTLTRHKVQHDCLKKHKKECLVLQTDPRQQARKLLLQVSNPLASLTKHLTYKKPNTCFKSFRFYVPQNQTPCSVL